MNSDEFLWRAGELGVALVAAGAVARYQLGEALRQLRAVFKHIEDHRSQIATGILDSAKFQVRIDGRVEVLERELLRLRDERHAENNWVSGKIGLLEHEVDVLKDGKG